MNFDTGQRRSTYRPFSADHSKLSFLYPTRSFLLLTKRQCRCSSVRFNWKSWHHKKLKMLFQLCSGIVTFQGKKMSPKRLCHNIRLSVQSVCIASPVPDQLVEVLKLLWQRRHPRLLRQIPEVSVARWQNLIPSFPWIGSGCRVWGRNPRKGRDQILQRSVAEP